MPPIPQLSPVFRLANRIQLRSGYRRDHGRLFVRTCSYSAPPPAPQPVKAKGKSNAQLNPTTSNPPTPPLDHRAFSQDQLLFALSPYSPGSPLLLPNGTYMFQKLQAFLRAQYPQFGFQEVVTPTIYKKSLWEKSGHWDNYADDMFSVHGRGATGKTENAETGQDEEYGLKPMNCPGHCLLFKHNMRSWRDLPVRYADFSALHRNEISGALTGLTRVRRFHQDDAHIFCRPDQILSEIESTLRFVGMVYDTFGLGPYKLLLSTRPTESFIGNVAEWDRAEAQLTEALNNSGREWAVNAGDGAFYGPKIDIILKDANEKEHQTATIQLDFQLPQRFELQYQASPDEVELGPPSSESDQLDPALRRPVIIHRAIYGSLERFMALLIEHYAGRYPFWLSPRPAIVLPLNTDPDLVNYALHIQSVLSGLQPSSSSSSSSPSSFLSSSPSKPTPQPLSTTHLPIDIDASARPLQKKLFEARSKKYNYIILIGRQELESQTLRLQFGEQENHAKVLDTLQGVTGRGLDEKDVKKGQVGVGLSVGEARRLFVGLVDGFL